MLNVWFVVLEMKRQKTKETAAGSRFKTIFYRDVGILFRNRLGITQFHNAADITTKVGDVLAHAPAEKAISD